MSEWRWLFLAGAVCLQEDQMPASGAYARTELIGPWLWLLQICITGLQHFRILQRASQQFVHGLF
jgi:hypothetical protein